MALRAASRVGSMLRVAPQLSAASARGFANFDERERGEEVSRLCGPSIWPIMTPHVDACLH